MATDTPTVTAAMQNLIAVFAPRCADRTTLSELSEMIVQGRAEWQRAHQLFQRIRQKTLAAGRSGDSVREAQYLFEEVCAKTLYNLSGGDAPFDAHVPFKIVPNAIAFARQLNIADSEVVQAIMPR
jgi:hypothetical protein